MSFLNPIALLVALFAVPIVVFYLLKTRSRRVPVSTVMFWQQAFEEKKTRKLWRQLRHIASLLMQLLLLALIVMAVADPFLNSREQQQRRIVVVLDTSASMLAVSSESGTRIEEARAAVSELISSLRAGDEMAIITAAMQPTVVSGLTSHSPTLYRLLAAVEPTDGPTDLQEAIAIGHRLLADHENGSVVVVTDGCFPAATEPAPDNAITWLQVGAPAGNVGITQFQVRRNLTDPIGYQILIEVQNLSDEVLAFNVEFELNGGLLDVVPLKLQPNEVWQNVFEATSTSGGLVTATLTFEGEAIANALKVDDVANAVLPSRQRIPVTLVTEGNWFLQRVLEANSIVDLTVASQIPDSISDEQVVVLHRTTPATLPAGKFLVVQPVESNDLWELQSAIDDPLVGWQDASSELLRHVRLDNVTIPQASRIRPTAEYQKLIESVAGDPLYLRFPRPDGDVLVLSIDLEKGDLPLRTAFPILLTNALSSLVGHSGEMVESIPAGHPTSIRLPTNPGRIDGERSSKSDSARSARRERISAERPAGVFPSGSSNGLRGLPASGLTLTSPNGRTRTVQPPNDDMLTVTLDQAGVWELVGNPKVVRNEPDDTPETLPSLIACNLANAQESDLRPPRTLAGDQDSASSNRAGRPMWFYLTLAALLLVFCEWGLFHRRWIA